MYSVRDPLMSAGRKIVEIVESCNGGTFSEEELRNMTTDLLSDGNSCMKHACTYVQWNLRMKDTLGLTILSSGYVQVSFMKGFHFSRRVLYWRFHCTYVVCACVRA